MEMRDRLLLQVTIGGDEGRGRRYCVPKMLERKLFMSVSCEISLAEASWSLITFSWQDL